MAKKRATKSKSATKKATARKAAKRKAVPKKKAAKKKARPRPAPASVVVEHGPLTVPDDALVSIRMYRQGLGDCFLLAFPTDVEHHSL